MKKIALGVVVVAAVVATVAFGEKGIAEDAYKHVTVSDNFRTFFNTNYAFSASTTDWRQYPEATVGKPMFWLDCSDTNGWTISAAGAVSKVPNKGISDRYLTSSKDEIAMKSYYSGNGLWYNASIQSPVLTPGDNGLVGPYLDFGANGSNRCLFFDKKTFGEGDTAKDWNKITGVGTVIGVYRSYTGGGQVMGGDDWLREGNVGTNFVDALFKSNLPKQGMGVSSDARVWFGLQQNIPGVCFWSGNWEVVATQPNSASMESHGLCGNCQNVDRRITNGGQGVAEVMIFDKVLSSAQISNIVIYLERKWLGREHRGYNGCASISWLEIGGACTSYPSGGTETPIEVGVGETLTVGRLEGGRAATRPKLVKTGDGVLKFGNAANYGGEVTVRGGTLAMGGKRPIPTFDQLPTNLLVFHLDPSEASSLTLESGKVASIANLADLHGLSGTFPDAATQADESRRPTLDADVPSDGLALMDFGMIASSTAPYLAVSMKGAASTIVAAGTAIAVVDQRTCVGRSLFDKFFSSAADSYEDCEWTKSNGCQWRIFSDESYYIHDHATVNPVPSLLGSAWINGLPIDRLSEGYEAPAFNVLAMRTLTAANSGAISLIGARATNKAGGLRIGEVMIWRRGLTEQEILDVQAYLAKKWLRRVNPGYVDTTDNGVADLQYVVGGDGAKIDVPEGSTASVAHLSGDGVFEKTGAGTLKVGTFDGIATKLVVKVGAVVAAEGADVVSNCEIATEPSLHLDPSDSRFVTTYAAGGKEYIWRLHDPRGLISSGDNLVYWNLSGTPWLNSDAEVLCNGLPVVDFGEFCAWDNNKGGRMLLSKNLLNVRSVFYVLGSQNSGGNSLATRSDGACELDAELARETRNDFYRIDGNLNTVTKASIFQNACDGVKNGTLYVDGVRQESVGSFVPNGGYQLIELHTTSGCQLSGFGGCLSTNSRGGFRLGEVVVFERELTEREKVATRNYLLKKWRGVAEGDLAPLPAKPALAKPAFSPERLVADFGNPEGASYAGSIIGIRENMPIEIKNLPASLELNSEIKLLTADEIVGVSRDTVRSLVPTGEGLPEGFRIRLIVQDGVLKAKFVGKGLTLVVR